MTPMNPLAEIETVKALGSSGFEAVPMFESVLDEMVRLTRDLRG
jgi:hypothetical protein